jgi:hypothetical protein
MQKVKDIGFLAGLFLLATLLLEFFHKDKPSDLVSAPLATTEASRIVVADHKISVLSKKGAQAAYVPSSGYAVVSTAKDGNVAISVKQTGFSLQAGLGGIYADCPRLTLDLQLAYWRRFGAHVGLGFANAHPTVVPFFAASYRLDGIRLSNTSLLVGVSVRKDPVVGVRIEF